MRSTTTAAAVVASVHQKKNYMYTDYQFHWNHNIAEHTIQNHGKRQQMVYQITLQESNGTLVVGTFFYYFFSLSFLMRIGRKAATAATALGTTDFVFITISQIS